MRYKERNISEELYLIVNSIKYMPYVEEIYLYNSSDNNRRFYDRGIIEISVLYSNTDLSGWWLIKHMLEDLPILLRVRSIELSEAIDVSKYDNVTLLYKRDYLKEKYPELLVLEKLNVEGDEFYRDTKITYTERLFIFLSYLTYIEKIYIFSSEVEYTRKNPLKLALVCPKATEEDWLIIKTIIRKTSMGGYVRTIRYDKIRDPSLKKLIDKEKRLLCQRQVQ